MSDPYQGYGADRRFFDLEFTLDPAFMPRRPDTRRYRLLDAELTLDPTIEGEIRALNARLALQKTLDEMLRPNWALMEQIWGQYLNLPLTPSGPAPAPRLVIPPAPAAPPLTPPPPAVTPRPGELKDLIEAIYKTQQAQRLVKQARDEGMKHLRLLDTEWKGASPPEKVAMVSVTTLFVAGTITPILAAQPTRKIALGLIDGKDIPTPIDGLSLRLHTPDDEGKKGWGGGVTAPLGVPGLSFKGDLRDRPGSVPDLNLTVTLDVTELIRKQRKK